MLFADDAGPASDIISATTNELAAFPLYDMPVVPMHLAVQSDHGVVFSP